MSEDTYLNEQASFTINVDGRNGTIGCYVPDSSVRTKLLRGDEKVSLDCDSFNLDRYDNMNLIIDPDTARQIGEALVEAAEDAE